jgi:ElaB/YqjD/DUF883 family membrane-anchored ribosome-binding protein
MTQSIDEGKDRLIEDFNAVIADAEQLLGLLAAAGGEKADALRASAEENLEAARERLAGLQAAAREHAAEASKAGEAYIREHPWQSIGIVAIAAALAGLVLGVMLNRR